jgi:predicted DNA-binding mobile mystery protein A
MRPKSSNQALARKHLDRRLTALQAADLVRPPRGWIKAIREALGMTTAQLAERAGVSQSRIPRVEQGEIQDTITLKTLRSVAESLNCTLVYALVPNQPLDDMLRARARALANQQLARTQHTMKLENQALSVGDLETERERLIDELLSHNAQRLWDAT